MSVRYVDGGRAPAWHSASEEQACVLGMQYALAEAVVCCTQDPGAPPRAPQPPWARKLPHSPSVGRLFSTGQAGRPPSEDLRTPSPVSAAPATLQHRPAVYGRCFGPSSSGTGWQSALTTARPLTGTWHRVSLGGVLALKADMLTTAASLQCGPSQAWASDACMCACRACRRTARRRTGAARAGSRPARGRQQRRRRRRCRRARHPACATRWCACTTWAWWARSGTWRTTSRAAPKPCSTMTSSSSACQ